MRWTNSFRLLLLSLCLVTASVAAKQTSKGKAIEPSIESLIRYAPDGTGALHDREVPTEKQDLVPIALTPTLAKSCPKPGTLCFSAAPDAVLASAEVELPEEKIKISKFTRSDGGSRSWNLMMVANLRDRSKIGEVMVLVYDHADPQAIANREVTTLWHLQFDKPQKNFAARLVLDGEKLGLQAGHVYWVVVAQLIHQREQVLAQGGVQLE